MRLRSAFQHGGNLSCRPLTDMRPPEDMAVVLLAAGQSLRFGGNKLAAPLNGSPLIHHAAKTLSAIGFETALVVSSKETPDIASLGFERVVMTLKDGSLSGSIALGVRHAMQRGANSVLIALADMPFVPAAHFQSLIAAFIVEGSRVGTRVGDVLQPPAIFDKRYCDRLQALPAQSGAKVLLLEGSAVALQSDLACDIDTKEQLEVMRHDRNFSHLC